VIEASVSATLDTFTRAVTSVMVRKLLNRDYLLAEVGKKLHQLELDLSPELI
jgi:hypothetical protein